MDMQKLGVYSSCTHALKRVEPRSTCNGTTISRPESRDKPMHRNFVTSKFVERFSISPTGSAEELYIIIFTAEKPLGLRRPHVVPWSDVARAPSAIPCCGGKMREAST